MQKFCRRCGQKLDEKTGLCPNCDKSMSRKEKKLAKKEYKKATKKEKRAQWSNSKKIRRFLLKLILAVLLLIVLTIGTTGVLVYFEVVDFPVFSYVLERSGFDKREDVEMDPLIDNYIPEESTIAFDEETNLFYANNEVIVIFSNDTTDAQKEDVISYLNGELAGTIPELNMYQIIISNCDTLEELIYISDDVMIRFDYIIYATYDTATINPNNAYAPNDPWNRDVTEEDWEDSDIDGSNWWIEAIDAQNAWNYRDNFSEISIGICDSSFDTGHEDLKNRVQFPNEILESRNVVTPWWNDFNNETWSVSDQENYHGTHVAGIIGAEGDNKKGITGIVQNCKLLLAPYYRSDNMDAYLAWDSSTYANLSYLVKAGAKVINFSQGKTNFLSENTSRVAYSEEIIEREGNLASISIAQLIDSGYNNFIVVQSAGNGTGDTGKALDAIQNGWFASITDNSVTGYDDITISEIRSRVIIVGAIEQTSSGFQYASFSNYGNQVNICAPGVNIYSTVPGDVFYDFQFAGGYNYALGTSMSAPIVTGVCALTWSANPGLSAGEVKDIVCNNSHIKVNANPEREAGLTYNMVNAKLSVEAAINYEVDKNEEGKALGEFDQSQLPAGAVSFNGHYYYVYDLNTVTTWEEAKQYCKSQGGYLATVTSQEENEFVYSYLRNNFDYESAYFGLTDRKEEGNWVWDNGEISSYTNWHSGEPNSENPNEDFAMYYYKYSDGSWNDGDFGNKTVNNGRVFICEWGEYQMVANGQSQEPVRNTSDERDIVMVLDVSGSMSGEPMEETKKASSNFISTILQEDASIGIVTYDDSASMVSDFSVEESYLQSVAGSIDSGGSTNIEDGLRKAEEMLMSSNAKKKIIVLMSDGQPNVGMEGDELISYADTIKSNGTYIYTLGFFENMSGGKSDAQILMEEIASDGCHYEVANADDLRFFFGDIADQINGQKYIYVRIACPVDVNVTYGDETLSSAESDIVTRTSFGTLTFEENPNKSEDSTDDRIKILRLKDGTDYDIQIAGNGTGTMNYTIGFMDEVGEYSDLREFNDIEISNRTQIDTVAQNVSSTTLNVDSDGDGKYDLKYKAKANSVGEIVDYSYIRYIIYIAGILTLLLILYIQVKKWKRKSVEKAIKKKASQKRFCVHCGNMVSWDKKFCPKCGSKMENIN